jgi:hypothetical protein
VLLDMGVDPGRPHSMKSLTGSAPLMPRWHSTGLIAAIRSDHRGLTETRLIRLDER